MKKKVFIDKEHFVKSDFSKFRIAADVGATNTYIAILGVRDYRKFSLIFMHTYQTSEISKIYHALNQALKEAKETYDIETGVACIGASGPVSRQRHYIKLTNADLEISTKEIFSNSLLNNIFLVN